MTMPAAAGVRRPLMPGPTGGALLAVLPFLSFAVLFLVLPTCMLMVGAFQDKQGSPTLANLVTLLHRPDLMASFWISIKVSIASAVGGTI